MRPNRSKLQPSFKQTSRLILCLNLCDRQLYVASGYQTCVPLQGISPAQKTRQDLLQQSQDLQRALPQEQTLKCEPVARLYSVQNAPPGAKILHFLRHAEGTHNVQGVQYKEAAHLDARLTDTGMEQCRELAEQPQFAELPVECIIASPLTRTLQTAQLCFEKRLQSNLTKPRTSSCTTQVSARHDRRFSSSSKLHPMPVVACEYWRETVNYLCDKRRNVKILQTEFPYVDFTPLKSDDADPIWSQYEVTYGSHASYMGHREAKDKAALQARARKAWSFIAARPEQNIAVVSHRTFFNQLFQKMEGSVVSFEDEHVKQLLIGKPFSNCELRSVAYVPAYLSNGVDPKSPN